MPCLEGVLYFGENLNEASLGIALWNDMITLILKEEQSDYVYFISLVQSLS